MRTLKFVVCLLLVAGLACAAEAAQDGKKKPLGSKGVVEKVEEGKSFTIRIGGKKDPNAASRTFTISKETKFIIAGAEGNKEGTAADLKSGSRVGVEAEGDAAKVVTIMTARKKDQ
jgi:hypothetical protein